MERSVAVRCYDRDGDRDLSLRALVLSLGFLAEALLLVAHHHHCSHVNQTVLRVS